MTTEMAGFFTRLRDTLADDERPDAELVREYAATRSEEAFAELVRRFAPMVWAVCRRTVGHHQRAEDAFQATFLVLARKPGALRPTAAVGGWLHAVAVHTSLRARAMADRRRKRQASLAAVADPPAPDPTDPTDPQLLRMLDEEIAKLPGTLRSAVVLCELEGVGRRDAAARLGIAEGTLSSRLAAARKQLAARLRARGATLGLGGLFALVAGTPTTAAPPLLPTPTTTVSALAEGAIRMMYFSSLKNAVAVLLAATALALAGIGAYPTSAGEPERPPQPRRNAPVPAPKAGDGLILVGVNEEGKFRLDLLNLKGEAVATVPLPAYPSYHPTRSRDGKRVAVWQIDPPRPGARPGQPGGPGSVQGTMLVFDVDKPDAPLATVGDHRSGGIVFAPDGNSVYFNTAPEPTADPMETVTVYRFDLKTKKKEVVKVPAGHTVVDISPDGKTLLTNDYAKKNEVNHSTPYLVPLDTLKATPLSTACVRALRFSPDGTRVTALKTPDPKLVWSRELIVLNVKDGKETAVKLEKTHLLWDTAWSPDGKKLLVSRLVLSDDPVAALPPPPVAPGGAVPQPPPTNKPELTLCNPDGSEPKKLLDLKATANVFGIAWR